MEFASIRARSLRSYLAREEDATARSLVIRSARSLSDAADRRRRQPPRAGPCMPACATWRAVLSRALSERARVPCSETTTGQHCAAPRADSDHIAERSRPKSTSRANNERRGSNVRHAWTPPGLPRCSPTGDVGVTDLHIRRWNGGVSHGPCGRLPPRWCPTKAVPLDEPPVHRRPARVIVDRGETDSRFCDGTRNANYTAHEMTRTGSRDSRRAGVRFGARDRGSVPPVLYATLRAVVVR